MPRHPNCGGNQAVLAHDRQLPRSGMRSLIEMVDDPVDQNCSKIAMRRKQLFDQCFGSLRRLNDRAVIAKDHGAQLLFIDFTKHDRRCRVKGGIMIDHDPG